MTTGTTQHFVLRFGARAYLRLFVHALCIMPIAVGVSLGLAIDVLAYVDPVPLPDYARGWSYDDEVALESRRARHDLIFQIVLGTTALSALILPLVVLSRRQPRGMRLELDDWGVTEIDGDSVRTAIPWAGASVHARETIQKGRRSDRSGVTVARTLAVVSPAGWVIFAGLGGRLPTWVHRRRATGEIDFTTLARLGIDGRADGDSPVDPRDARRGALVPARVVGAMFLVALGLAAASVSSGSSRDQQVAGALLVIASVLALVRMVRPITELRALAAEEAQLAGARRFRLAGDATDGIARAEDENGRPAKLDLSSARHPDALLATREVDAWVALDAAAGASAYRGSDVTSVRAIETQRDRDERARLRGANRIELATRALFALALATLGALMTLGLHDF